MDIKPSHNLGAVTRLASGLARPPETKAAGDTMAFNSAEALNKALNATHDVRPDVVARAREVVAGNSYPPQETIQRIAVLLASHLDGE